MEISDINVLSSVSLARLFHVVSFVPSVFLRRRLTSEICSMRLTCLYSTCVALCLHVCMYWAHKDMLSVFKWGPSCVISKRLTICRRSLLPHRDLDSMAVANIQPAVFAQEHSLKSAVATVYTRALHSCLTLLTSVGLKPWWRYLRRRSRFFSAALWHQQTQWELFFLLSCPKVSLPVYTVRGCVSVSVVLDLVLFDINIFFILQ